MQYSSGRKVKSRLDIKSTSPKAELYMVENNDIGTYNKKNKTGFFFKNTPPVLPLKKYTIRNKTIIISSIRIEASKLEFLSSLAVPNRDNLNPNTVYINIRTKNL